MAQELGLRNGSDNELQQLILKRQGNREAQMQDMLASLEAKYCKPKATKKKKTTAKSKK